MIKLRNEWWKKNFSPKFVTESILLSPEVQVPNGQLEMVRYQDTWFHLILGSLWDLECSGWTRKRNGTVEEGKGIRGTNINQVTLSYYFLAIGNIVLTTGSSRLATTETNLLFSLSISSSFGFSFYRIPMLYLNQFSKDFIYYFCRISPQSNKAKKKTPINFIQAKLNVQKNELFSAYHSSVPEIDLEAMHHGSKWCHELGDGF